MQDDPSSTPAAAPSSLGSTRWNPVLPFVVSVIGTFNFFFAAGTTLTGVVSTFTLCFTVAYLTQIVFGRFFVALAFFETFSTTGALERCKDSSKSFSCESQG